MDVKRVLETFVAVSVFVIGALTAYHHYVEGKTPTAAAFQALEQYNGVMNAVVTAILEAVSRYRNAA